MIMIVSRIDATQIFFRTGQPSLLEKKTKYFPFFTPLPLSFGHPRSTSTSFCIKWIVGYSFQHPSYLLLNRRYCLGWEPKSPVIDANPFSSVLRSWLEFNFTSVPAEKTCHVPCCRRYGRVCSHMSEQYHKQSRGGQQLEIS